MHEQTNPNGLKNQNLSVAENGSNVRSINNIKDLNQTTSKQEILSSIDNGEEMLEISVRDRQEAQKQMLMEMGFSNKQEIIPQADEEIPFLVQGLVPVYSPTVIVGSPSTGKSLLSLQMCQSIISGQDFLGQKVLQIPNARCLYISHEDGLKAVAMRLKKQDKFLHLTDEQNARMDLLCEGADLQNALVSYLDFYRENPPVLIINDTLSDIFTGEIYKINEVKNFFNFFKDIVNQYVYKDINGNLFHPHLVFTHHTGKRTDTLTPHKDNALGSAGIPAGARTMVEIKTKPSDPTLKYFCITKGNYHTEEQKEKAIEMKINDFLCFEATGKKVALAETVRSGNTSANEEKYFTIKQMREEGKTWKEIGEKYNITSSAILQFMKKYEAEFEQSDETPIDSDTEVTPN